MERKLVTVRQINSIDPIPGADAIQVASVEGWKVVVKKGEFNIGDYCLYFEIDSFLPESDPRYAFLMKMGVREFEGAKGHKLRTVKLRGQISQGLVLPLGAFPELMIPEMKEHRVALRDFDFASILGIKKYEAPIPAELAGQVKGTFPSFIRKTDQERCQNLIDEIFWQNKESKYEVTTKLDGTSVTFYYFNGETGACSRNLELKINDENKDNSIVRMFIDSGLQRALQFNGSALNSNIAIQGELMGPGIQGNREALKKHTFFIFDMQNLDTGEYLTPSQRRAFVNGMISGGLDQSFVQHVPVLHESVSLEKLAITNVDELLAFAEGKSINNLVREGVVFKREDGKFSFKAISNTFLAKEKD
jgi:RNA ligase (TIGR02306 family)